MRDVITSMRASLTIVASAKLPPATVFATSGGVPVATEQLRRCHSIASQRVGAALG
jgi:hypothetical protein